MKYVLFYESSDEVLTKAPLYAAAHRERWQRFLTDGSLLLIGPFANPKDGAMAIFTTRVAAEAFAREDPFVLNGVVKRWHVQQWNEATG